MLPPIPCWSDGFAVTFHYRDLSVVYHKDPTNGKVTPLNQIPKQGLSKVILWNDRHPLLEVHVSADQRPIFTRLEADRGEAKAYLVGWQQGVGESNIQSIGYYLPPGSSMPGRIVVAGEYKDAIIDRFTQPDFREAPVPCWPDSTTYSFYYQNGDRVDRLNRDDGTETHSDRMPRTGLRKVALWHYGLPVVECHYQPGQKAIFRRRNEWTDSVSAAVVHQGVPIEGLMASTSWFAHKKAVEDHKYRVLYMLGWQQTVSGKSIQSITYYHPQNGELPPRVVMAGKFSEDDDSYLPLPTGEDQTVIT